MIEENIWTILVIFFLAVENNSKFFSQYQTTDLSKWQSKYSKNGFNNVKQIGGNETDLGESQSQFYCVRQFGCLQNYESQNDRTHFACVR